MALSDSFWSAEARVLVDPARVFRDAARESQGRGTAWRRPVALLVAFGALVSVLASGRLSVRLILDGAVSFAFVVAIEIAALAIASRTGLSGRRDSGGPAPAPFAREIDVFFIGNAPWLLWMIAAGALFSVVPPRAFGSWFRFAFAGCLVPAVWSAWIDFHFFRDVLRRPPRGAWRAVLVNRAVGWVATIGIFLGIAIWSLYEPPIAAWLGL